MSLEERMKRLISDELGVDYDEVSDKASFTDDLGADALDLVELMKSVQEEFNIDISAADAERLTTVGDAIKYVRAAEGQAGTTPGSRTAAEAKGARAAATDDRSDTTVYKVVVNHEEQYSIWPADKEPAKGWTATSKQGSKADCLAYIAEVWTDMRPLSVRKKMEGGG
jgi:MbtH protein